MSLPVNLDLYAAFLIASTLLILMPGPVVSLVVANSLRHGGRYGIATSLSANAGTTTLLTAGAIATTAVLTLLSQAFDIIRILGAAYLIYLGIQEWRSRGTMMQEGIAEPKRSMSKIFWQGYLIGLTNPKTLLFFAAFFPQFVDPNLPFGAQMAFLTASFLVLATCLDTCYAILASRMRVYLMDAKRALIRARLTGTLLILTGIGVALSRADK